MIPDRNAWLFHDLAPFTPERFVQAG